MRLCFATNNANKIAEVRAALPPGFSVSTLAEINCFEELPETSPTLEGNAVQKALFVLEHYNVPCFADDTGLEVAALNGEPGVYSARYAGPARDSNENVALLLEKLAPHSDRKAQFRTIFALVGMGPEPVLFEGTVRGTIARERRGNLGFGYDPVFIPEGSAETFAEMTMAEKNRLSHRARALQKLVSYLATGKPT